MGPRITISYCCRVTSCTRSLGSQDSLYRGQIQKLLQCCREPYQQIPLVITIQRKYSLTHLRRTVSWLLKERSKSNFWLYMGTNYHVTPRLPVQDVTRQKYEMVISISHFPLQKIWRNSAEGAWISYGLAHLCSEVTSHAIMTEYLLYGIRSN